MSRVLKQLMGPEHEPEKNLEENSETSESIQLEPERPVPELRLVPALEHATVQVPPWPPKGLKLLKKKKSPAATLVILGLAIAGVGVYYIRSLKPKVEQSVVLNLPSKPEAFDDTNPNFTLNQEAIKLFKAQKYKEAKIKFEQVISQYPSSGTALNNLGMVYFKLENFEKAKAQFREAIKRNASDANAYNNLASVAIEEDELEEAISYLQKALMIDPKLLEARLNLARAYELSDMPIEAAEEYQIYLANPMADPFIRRILPKRIEKLKSFERYLKDEKTDEKIE